MNCDDVSDVLAGYALGALDASEHDAVETHLLACREHDAELTELRATRFALGLLEAAPEPSVRLGARIAGIPGPPEIGPRRRFAVPPWAAAAAVLVLAAGFGTGWFAGSRLSDGAAPAAVPAATSITSTRFSYAMRGDGGQLVRLAGTDGGESVTVTMANTPRLPAERAYQLWVIRDGRWLSIGACNTDENGWWLGDFAFAIQPGEEVAVTVEPAGGSPKPTSPPLLRQRF